MSHNSFLLVCNNISEMSHQALSIIIKHHQESCSIIKHHQAFRSIRKHHKASWNLMKPYEALQGIINYVGFYASIAKHFFFKTIKYRALATLISGKSAIVRTLSKDNMKLNYRLWPDTISQMLDKTGAKKGKYLLQYKFR